MTSFGVDFQSNTYNLSDDAKTISPTSENGDFAFQELELKYETTFVGEDKKSAVDLGVFVGSNWYAGDHLSDFVGFTAQRRLLLNQKTSLSFGGGLSRVERADSDDRSATVSRAFGSWSRSLESGDRLSFSLQAANSEASSYISDNFKVSATSTVPPVSTVRVPVPPSVPAFPPT